MLLRLVENVLRQAGFQVLTAATADEALGAFRADPAAIDAVLIDAGMPPSGAREILQSMLALRDDLGVIVSSGSSPDAELRDLLTRCGGRFLRKPFDPEALISAVSALGRSGS